MACTGNVLGGHSPAPIAVTTDENENQSPRPNVPLQGPSTMLKDDMGSQGKPRMPLRLPFSVPPDLAREQLKSLQKRRGSSIPVDSSRVPRHPDGPPPAVARVSLATAEVNSSGRLAAGKQMGQDSINVPPKFSSGPPSLMMEVARVSNEGTERDAYNAKYHGALPQAQCLFPHGGPQVRGPPLIPTVRPGIMVEVPPGYMRTASNERLPHVSFPLRSPWPPMENWPRPITVPPNIAPLLSWPRAPGFICSQTPGCNPFFTPPMLFPPRPIYGPPPPPTFANFPPRNI